MNGWWCDTYVVLYYFSYKQAQATVSKALPKLIKLAIPTKRPDDYFAEMVKSDDHMQRVLTLRQLLTVIIILWEVVYLWSNFQPWFLELNSSFVKMMNYTLGFSNIINCWCGLEKRENYSQLYCYRCDDDDGDDRSSSSPSSCCGF